MSAYLAQWRAPTIGRGCKKPIRPIVDPAHPLSRGMTACYPLGEGSGAGTLAVSPFGKIQNIVPGQTLGAGGDGATSGLAANPWGASHHGGLALQFNGSGNGTLQNTNTMQVSGARPRSYSIWVNQTTITTIKGILTVFGANTALKYFNLFCGVNVAGDVYVATSNRDWFTGALLSNGTWAHIVATYNGGAAETSGNIKIYFNGVNKSLTSAGTATGVLNTYDAAQIGLGYDSNTLGRQFTGSLEGVRIYNRELSAAEVAWLYVEPYAGLIPAAFVGTGSSTPATRIWRPQAIMY